MKTLLSATASLALILSPLALEAGPKGNGNGNGNGRGNGNGAWAQGFHCPPGLADRDPACVPPGQARERRERVEEERNEVRDWAEDVIEVEADDDEDRDQRQAIAIIGSLMGLALIEQARRERQAEASLAEPVEPLEPVTGPSAFSFSEVPSRPAAIERLAMATPWGDAADPEPVLDPPPAPTVAPVPLATPSPTLRIPPPPPMAGDVTDLLGGGGTAVTGY